jgi:hypothetical protein
MEDKENIVPEGTSLPPPLSVSPTWSDDSNWSSPIGSPAHNSILSPLSSSPVSPVAAAVDIPLHSFERNLGTVSFSIDGTQYTAILDDEALLVDDISGECFQSTLQWIRHLRHRSSREGVDHFAPPNLRRDDTIPFNLSCMTAHEYFIKYLKNK